MKKNVLVVCDDNTLYSKIAEAYLKKYAGYWKNIFSAGISISGKKVSPHLFSFLEKDNFPVVDHKLMSVEEYDSFEIDYVVALTKNAFDQCTAKGIGKEVILLDVSITDNIDLTSEDIKNKILQFVKSGPIKRWLKQ